MGRAEFNLDDIRLNPTAVRAGKQPSAKPVARHEERIGTIPERPWAYVKYPGPWRRCLRKTKSVATWRLADYLLEMNWRAQGSLLRLPDKLARELGVARSPLYRALQELSAAGLIKVATAKGEGTKVKVLLPIN